MSTQKNKSSFNTWNVTFVPVDLSCLVYVGLSTVTVCLFVVFDLFSCCIAAERNVVLFS